VTKSPVRDNHKQYCHDKMYEGREKATAQSEGRDARADGVGKSRALALEWRRRHRGLQR